MEDGRREGGQKTEVRDQKSDDRGQMTEGGGAENRKRSTLDEKKKGAEDVPAR